MNKYEFDLISRLNTYSAQYENHGGITAEAADALARLIAERDAANELHIRQCGMTLVYCDGKCKGCSHSDVLIFSTSLIDELANINTGYLVTYDELKRALDNTNCNVKE